MLNPQITFLAYEKKQIDLRWLNKKLGFEANVFDGKMLDQNHIYSKIEKNIEFIRSENSSPITLHFPTDNADYLKSINMKKHLYKFIDLAARKNISGITIHSNQFLSINEYLEYDLEKNRKIFLNFLRDVDNYIADKKIWIGVENLPIIGNNGDDFDPLFIYPEDYSSFDDYKFKNIGITWDIGHWFITLYTQKSIKAINPNLDIKMHNPLDFLSNADKIKHLHFSSFDNLAFPFSSSKCKEGKTPQSGMVNDRDLRNCILEANRHFQDSDIGITFEVQEKDYSNRVNSWETLKWFENVLQ